MSTELRDGQYNIVPSFLVQPSPGLGADPTSGLPGAGSPVVFNGENQVWTIKRRPDGTYDFFLGGPTVLDDNDEVWVNGSILSGAHWNIDRLPGSDFYLIVLPGTDRAWTSRGLEGKSKVFLQTIGEPLQEFFFRPAGSNA